MNNANVYLSFNGTCEEAFEFYKSIFGGKFAAIARYSEMPESDEYFIPAGELSRLMHVSLVINESTVLMGSDVVSEHKDSLLEGNNFAISINAESKEEADKLFAALSAGGVQKMIMQPTFWGSYFGMLTDKFGINWMINA
ncbi:MAG: VOC family protein [Pyrinomonadaceae bacterium]